MDTLRIQIHNIKNINEAQLELPFDNGIYTFVGTNGCGKSTMMLCLAQLLSNQLNRLTISDTKNDSFVRFETNGKCCLWKRSNNLNWKHSENTLRYNGLYEGSLFYGTRFEDSTNIEQMIASGRITEQELADADDYVKNHMSFILHGDLIHYRTLKRFKNKHVAQQLSIKNRPYFINVESHFVSQYRMSSGECLLVSLLHFLYNSIVRRSLPSNQKVLVLIDELELALHPVAVLRLMDFLKQLVKEHSNLIIYLSSHSPEVIRTISPSELFKVTNNNGNLTIEANCYPSYLIRDLYSNVSPDFLFLVEDELSQLVVNKILSKYSLRTSKLIHCVPVGGWQNVLELHKELYSKKVLGTNTAIISILDGDIANNLNKEQKKLPHIFLPIPSIEKFLYGVIKENNNPQLRRIINDKYFIVQSLDEIVSQYNKGTLEGAVDNNKNFYKKIRIELENIGTKESVFVTGLCDDIIENININAFIDSLRSKLQ
ncbi:AAA family ATPase [Bacteroides stercorirosoris]|uniref:ATP-dependent nuclease n=1 Tax=Bacteroides stercorirosoris TaxID=871324 RepID=UPI003517FC76